MNLLANPLDFDSTPLKEVCLTLRTAGGSQHPRLGRAASWEEPAPLMTSRVELSGQQLPWGRDTKFHLVNINYYHNYHHYLLRVVYVVFMCVFGGMYVCKWQMLNDI